MIKVLAVASMGGHWIQLLRVVKGLGVVDNIVYMSTSANCAMMVKEHQFYRLHDFSRWNAYMLFPTLLQAINVIRKESPSVVITTGAAPGLIVLLVAVCMCKRTIWIDSIANVNNLSLSGRIASKIASRTYTQWVELAHDKICFVGNVLG